MNHAELKPAIYHDWLNGMRGGEKCLEALLDIFPKAEVFTLIYEPSKISKKINSRIVHVHPISKYSIIKNKYRNFIPVFPLFVGRWPKSDQLSEYDFIISSSHCVAKSFNISNLPHICYCYSPMRYIWDMFDDYFLKEGVPFWKTVLMKMVRPSLQKWDKGTAQKVSHFIAISHFISKRIERCYDKPSSVVYPFADLEFYTPAEIEREDFYLVVSALVPYKNIDVVINAFNASDRRLVVIGTGPEEKLLSQLANDNIKFLGWADDETVRDHYRKAKAFIFPGVEDFGITPVEAMACGCPVIALKEGGTCETVVDSSINQDEGTGVFFETATVNSLNDSIDTFENKSIHFKSEITGKRAEIFSISNFYDGIKKCITEQLPCSND